MPANGYDGPNRATKKKLDERISRLVAKGAVPCNSGLDPYLAWDRDPRTQEWVMRKKTVPEYLNETDAEVLVSCRAWAYSMDMGLFSIGRARFGWDFVLSIIPLLPWAVAVVFSETCDEVTDKLRIEDHLLMRAFLFKKFLYSLFPIFGALVAGFQKFQCSSELLNITESRLLKRYANDDDERSAELKLWVPLEMDLERAEVGQIRKSQFVGTGKNKGWEHDVEEGRAGRFV